MNYASKWMAAHCREIRIWLRQETFRYRTFNDPTKAKSSEDGEHEGGGSQLTSLEEFMIQGSEARRPNNAKGGHAILARLTSYSFGVYARWGWTPFSPWCLSGSLAERSTWSSVGDNDVPDVPTRATFRDQGRNVNCLVAHGGFAHFLFPSVGKVNHDCRRRLAEARPSISDER